MEKTRVVFIINPISGIKRIVSKQTLIDTFLDKDKFEPTYLITGYAGHAVSLAAQCAEQGYDIVVAVGGDGTVNEVGRGLIHTGVPMGIIPCGSGNGLARHLGIPLDFMAAVRWLGKTRILDIDYGLMNGRPFFTTCGVGFDALVSYKFAQGKGRGKLRYLENILHEVLKYHNETYRLIIDGEETDMEAFLVTCANADQWGNNAYIAPTASLQDGMLDISVIPHFTAADVPMLAFQLMNKQLDKNPKFFSTKCRDLVIVRQGEGVAHFDGDPLRLENEIRICVHPGGLRVAAPDKKREV